MTLSEMRDRLQQLLDGEIDASEIADDAALVSLADRLYGIKIAPVKPVKSRDFVEHQPGAPVTEVPPPTNMLIEVIEPVGLPAGNLPHLEMPDLPSPTINIFLNGLFLFVSINSSSLFIILF